MLFPKLSRRRRAAPDEPLFARAIRALLRFAVHSVFRAVAIAIVVAGVVYLRLLSGPIHLGFLGQMLATKFNEGSQRVEAQLGDLVLTLGAPGEPAGFQFVDVRVMNAEGVLLFAVPKLTASFHVADLIAGRPWPTRIAVIRPEARIERIADGRFRFGLGGGPEAPAPAVAGTAPAAGADDALDDAADDVPDDALQFAAVERVIDGFVGDIEPAPEISRLHRIEILGADLTYENAATGHQWRTERADLRVFRIEGGARARLDIGLANRAETGAALSISAERLADTGETWLAGRFQDLRPEHVAEQLEQMEWLRLFDAPLSGRLSGTVKGDGRIEGLAGTLTVGSGRILALGEEGKPIRRADLSFEYEPGLSRMRVTEFALSSPALDARLTGFVDLVEDETGGPTGLAGQLEIGRIRVDVPEVFSDSLEFDGGQIAARLRFAPLAIEVAQAHLRRGDLVLDVGGRARVIDDVWRTDLRAGGRNLSVGDLVRYWPLAAAEGARHWVDGNIRRASIDGVVAHLRFVGDVPTLALDFTFSGLDTTYLEDMTMIREARGRGALSLDAFNLIVEGGEVEPVAGAPIRLDGSEVRFPALRARPSPGEITLRAAGPSGSILTLINEDPLNLTGKLGLDPATVAGHSEVAAELRLPLVDDLGLDDVAVEAKAVLHELRMPFGLPNGQVLDVAGQRIELQADIEGMHFSGDAVVDGRPINIDWTEHYGRGANQREMTFRGAATPPLLARFGIDDRNFNDGEAPMVVSLAQTGQPDYAFTLAADMGPAKLVIPELGWTKPPGRRGRLEASGTYGDAVAVDSFSLDTDELQATGAAELGEGGYIRSAQIARARYLGLADVTARVARGPGDAFLVDLGGERVDLAVLDTLPAAAEGGAPGAGTGTVPIEMGFNVREMVVTPRLTARPAHGRYRLDSAGNRTARLEGLAAGQVPFAADFVRSSGQPGKLAVTSAQAGELLAAAGLFSTARGGEMQLSATLAGEDVTGMEGQVNIRDVTVRGAGTFTSILDEGGVADAAAAAKQEGGLKFDRVELPFEYRDGVLTLDDATARSTLLAVKMEGSVDENAGEVDIIGVISPAYALTGLLDSIPLVGDILSGGKGEGVLAMTFSVSGPLDAPQFSVNPLTLLAPGFLRKIFSGRNRKPDERFLEQLKREID